MNSIRINALLLVFTLSALGATAAELEKYEGTFTFVGDAGERDTRHQAIDTLSRRSTGLDEALGGATVPPSINVDVAGGELTILSELGPVSGPADGSAFEVPAVGLEPVQVKREVTAAGDLIEVQRFHQNRRGRSRVGSVLRVDTYRLSEDGARLTRTTRFQGGSLREPVHYQLTFERVVQTAEER